MKFCSTTASFPKDQLVLGQYLGLLIDIGPEMTTKILTPTCEAVHRSTYRLLMPEELTDPVKQDHMKDFLWTAEERWGTWPVRGQLEVVGLIGMPDLQPYLDNQQTDKTFPALEEEVTLEAGDKYIQVSIMIPRSNTSACKTIVSCKRNAKGKIIRCAMTFPS